MRIIQILGKGCPSCEKLAENAEVAARELGIEYQLEKVTDLKQIMAHGVMLTPGLVVDGEVKSVGKVLSSDEIKELLH